MVTAGMMKGRRGWARSRWLRPTLASWLVSAAIPVIVGCQGRVEPGSGGLGTGSVTGGPGQTGTGGSGQTGTGGKGTGTGGTSPGAGTGGTSPGTGTGGTSSGTGGGGTVS